MAYNPPWLLDEIKRKIRKLKKLELKIRFGSHDINCCPLNAKLVWDEFFCLNENTGKSKYNLSALCSMDKDEYKNVIDEYFFNVYYRFYRENGFVSFNLYDPEMLSRLGLPYDADQNAIKARFRELAKKYHPDAGGDAEKFIELMDSYKKLIN